MPSGIPISVKGENKMSKIEKIRTIETIPIEKLVVSEANVRKHGVDKERLKESIEKDGVLEPLHVWYNHKTGVFEIMQGQHRYYGALATGIKDMECVIHYDIGSLDEAKKWCRKQICLQEDLSLLDKLQIARDLKKEYGSLKEGCRQEGLSYSKLSDWSSLGKLSREVVGLLFSEKSDSPKLDLPLRKLKEIARLPKEKQMEATKEVQGMNDFETRRYLKEVKMENSSRQILVDVSYTAYHTLEQQAEKNSISLEKHCSQILEKESGSK